MLCRSAVVGAAAVALSACVGCDGSSARTLTSGATGGVGSGAHQASARLPQLIDNFFANDPADVWRNRRAVLVLVGRKQVVARYHHRSSSTPVDIQSAGKSITATLIGTALGEHLLPGLDATLDELLPAYRPPVCLA